MPSLDQVPDEIVRHILVYVPPDENLAGVSVSSRRLHHLADEGLLWRYYCRSSFEHWHRDHRFPEKLAGAASDVDWKRLWMERQRRNARTAHLFDGVLSTKVGRLQRFESICTLGYDAKDFLLEQCRADEGAEDVLARRFYANSVLDSIHRGMAVDEWSKFASNMRATEGLDRALAAFDMFVLHDQPEDIDYVSRSFDEIAQRFRKENPTCDEKNVRQKSLMLLVWLRANNYMGMDDQEINYRNIRNCLIGHALSDEDHPSLPLISSAIYCSVAERLGLAAYCASIPSHVHTIVFSPRGETLDGAPAEDPDAREKMFLDPYGSDYEVTLEELRLKLVEFGWNTNGDAFLHPAAVPVIVQRTAQNIRATYIASQHLGEDNSQAMQPPSPIGDGSSSGSIAPRASTRELTRLRCGYSTLNMEALFYGGMWANVLMRSTSDSDWDENLDGFLNRVSGAWSEDAWIVKKYLLPLYQTFIASQQPRHRHGYDNVSDILAMLSNVDQRQPIVSRRYTEEIQSRVRYRIGQVFRHKRYGYIGIINGWGSRGAPSLPTPMYMMADEERDNSEDSEGSSGVPRRMRRTYYTCLRPTVDRLLVAQDNIEIVTNPDLIPDPLMFLAGKFFKRFDSDSCTFESNIKEFFPDD